MKKIFTLILLTLFSYELPIHGAESLPFHTAFIAKKNGKILKEIGNCDHQNPPCSTFKVALALMGFDSGILRDKDFPKWTFKKEYEANFQSWYRPEIAVKYGWQGEHTPATFMQKSVVWFSHQITQGLGEEKFQDYINKLNYGNKDISGTPGKNDGLFNSWLETSLKISPREQVAFLEKLITTSLDISKEAQLKTMEIMVKRNEKNQPTLWNSWKLYGKTGGGTGCHRWFVGWVEKGDEKIIFAQYVGLKEDTPDIRAQAPMAIDAAKENMMGLF